MSNDMTTRHTQGLLEVRRETAIDYRPNLIYGNEGGSLVAVLQGGGPRRAITGPEEDANARRLVACWNACTGIGTETLERVSAGKLDIKLGVHMVAELEQQRDELLEALKELHRECVLAAERAGTKWPLTGPAGALDAKVRDALAKATHD